MKNNKKCPTAKGTRAASKKPTPPKLPQEIQFAKTLKKIAARQKNLPAKSDKRLLSAMLKNRFDYEWHRFCLTEALQKAAAAVQEIGSAYALLAERRRKNGEEANVHWMLPEEQKYFLAVAAKFPSPTMLGNLTTEGLWRLAGFLPDAPSTDPGNIPLTQLTKNADPTTTKP